MKRTESGSGQAGGLLLGLCALLVVVGMFWPGGSSPAAADYQPMSAPARPVRLVVPSLGIRSAVKPIQIDQQGVLDPPANVREVGWWQGSARPGATRGQTVLTGHTVHTGGGVMDHLGQLRRGKLVKVVTPRGTMVYRTTRTLTLTKAALARRAVELFGQKRTDDRLVLITCSGWTGSEYTKNVVVFATPLGVPTKTS